MCRQTITAAAGPLQYIISFSTVVDLRFPRVMKTHSNAGQNVVLSAAAFSTRTNRFLDGLFLSSIFSPFFSLYF